jgi:hypothetical protein
MQEVIRKRQGRSGRAAIRMLTSCILLLTSTTILGCKPGKGAAQATPATYAVDKTFERGPLSVRVRLDHDKITIAQTLELELAAQIQPGYKVTLPKIDKALENFALADWSNLGDKLGDDRRVIRSYRYRLEPFVSGKYQIPALTFQFQDANDPNKAFSLDTEPIDVEVTSLLGQDRANLKIADIEGVVTPPRPPSRAWTWAAVALVVTGLGVGAWVLLRARRGRQIVRIFKPAHELAYDRLRALVEAKLIEQGRTKEFYQQVSDVLRHYIEDRFSLHAPEQTTDEFLSALSRTDGLAQSDKAGLGEFLQHCDLVKFATHQPTADQIQRTFDLVKAFIEKTRSDQHQVDVTDGVPALGTSLAEAAS